MQNSIKVLVFRPGQEPCVEDIENSLDKLQEFVNGYIEAVTLDDDLCLICNEEGKIYGLPHNRYLYDGVTLAAPVDELVGNCLVCRIGSDEDFASVQDGDLQRVYGTYIA